MGLFSFLTAAPKTVDDIFDKDSGLLSKAGAWVGNMNYTDEERAEMNAKSAEAFNKFVIDTLAENTDRSKARREIAVFWMKFYAIMIFMCGIVWPISAEWSQVWFNLSTSLSVGGIAASVSAFFFGAHIHRQHMSKKND